MNDEMYMSIKHHSTSVLIFKEQCFGHLKLQMSKSKNGENNGVEPRSDLRVSEAAGHSIHNYVLGIQACLRGRQQGRKIIPTSL